MKKVFVLAVTIFLLAPVAGFAAAIGGAETLGQGELSIGVEQEIVFERKMKDATRAGGKVEVELDKAYRTMAKINYGLLDNLDVYARLGTAKFNVKQRVFTPADERGKKKSKGDFAYGAGLKWNMPLEEGWFLGVDAQYLRHRNKYSYSSVGLSVYDVDEDKLTLQEWHVAPYIAKEINQFIPYLGVRYSDARLKSKGESTWMAPCNWKTKAKKNVGVFVGTGFKIDDVWSLNLEGRFIDETAMSLGGTFKF